MGREGQLPYRDLFKLTKEKKYNNYIYRMIKVGNTMLKNWSKCKRVCCVFTRSVVSDSLRPHGL